MVWTDHFIMVPVLAPLLVAGLLLFVDDRHRLLKAWISTATTILLLVVAVVLLRTAQAGDNPGNITYLLGNWPPPFAIVLVLDRLSALMLLLAAVLAVPTLLFSLARWHKGGAHFHPLFLLLLMGLNGAFLTGDLFNLFVFFEVMLAASYGLALHGSGNVRVRAGLHYIAINLAASLLFLIGVAMIYGVTGTLNMADLAIRVAAVSGQEQTMLEVGAAILGVAFLVKAGMWPLSFWLPSTYAAASAPVAAMFAILTKVGIYIVLRLSLLFFGEESGASYGFGSMFLFIGGLATIVFGMIGVLASQALGRLAGYAVLVSSGTLLAAFGLSNSAVTASALFYLVSSTLTIAAVFLMVELVERGQDAAASILAVTREAFVDSEDKEEAIIGVAIPGTVATLGIAFAACGLLLAGLPPLSGFVAKFALLSSAVNPAGLGHDGPFPSAVWWFAGLLIVSGLAALIAMAREGIRIFWTSADSSPPRVLVLEFLPVAMLLGMTIVLTLQAGPAMRYMTATVQSLTTPAEYVDNVMTAAPVPTSVTGDELP